VASKTWRVVSGSPVRPNVSDEPRPPRSMVDSSGWGDILAPNPFGDVGDDSPDDHGASDPTPAQRHEVRPSENRCDGGEQVERSRDVAMNAPAPCGIDNTGHPRDQECWCPQQHSRKGRYQTPENQHCRRDAPQEPRDVAL